MAAKRRLTEELGLDANIYWAFDFIYEASFDNGLHEFEYDHVYTGVYNGPDHPNPSEVTSYCYKSLDEIKEDLEVKPQLYTAWFKIALPKLEAYLATNQVHR